MNLVKMTKKKVMIGALSLGVLTSVGVGFAATDYGQKVADWYGGLYNNATTEIQNDTATHTAGKVREAYNQLVGMNNGMTTAINNEKGTQEANVTDAIGDRKDGYIGDVNAERDEILNGMEAQFNNIFTMANNALNTAAAQAQRQAENVLTTSANQTGSAALQEMETNITATTQQAKSELQQALDAAEAEIAAKLENEKNTTKAEIKAAIDAKVAEVMALLETKVEQLKQEQFALIQAKAAELQQMAENELDSVVVGQ